jgi:predicted protein tyrosine phosphatase
VETRAGPLRLLFVCSRNRRRSPTAERVFEGRDDCEVASAGLAPDAGEVLTPELVEWAEIVFVMEPVHAATLRRRFRSSLKATRVVCLDIADDYEFMDIDLIAKLQARVAPCIRGKGRAPVVFHKGAKTNADL